MQFPKEQDETSVIEAESRKVFDKFGLGHGADQAVIDGAQKIDEAVFPAGSFHAADDPVAFLPFRHKFRDHVHRILKIRAQQYGAVPVRLTHPVKRGVELSEVSRVQNRLSVGVAGAQYPQLVARAIGRVVVYEQDSIVILGQCALKLLDDRIVHGHDVHAFVEAWSENRNQRPPAATLNLRRHI